MSTAPDNAIASADSVLTATFWIFSECQAIGFTGLRRFSPIPLWVAIIIIPWWESWFFSEANDASENARNRTCSNGIGWTRKATSEYCLASCKVRFASINVLTFALLILLCNHPSLEHKSGLEFTAACCKLPMTARSDCPSSSVTTSSVCNLRLRDRVKALMSLTYWLWSTVMEESGFWEILKPVKVNSLLLRDPKRNFCSNCRNFSWNTWFPQHKP